MGQNKGQKEYRRREAIQNNAMVTSLKMMNFDQNMLINHQ
jgi:hypothetical protein